MTRLDEIEQRGTVSSADILALVAVARAAAALTKHGLDVGPESYPEYEATLDALAPLLAERGESSAGGST